MSGIDGFKHETWRHPEALAGGAVHLGGSLNGVCSESKSDAPHHNTKITQQPWYLTDRPHLFAPLEIQRRVQNGITDGHVRSGC